MTMGAAQSDMDAAPKLSQLVQDQQPEEVWRKEVLDRLTELVLVQKEAARVQEQVVQLLSTLGSQVGLPQVQFISGLDYLRFTYIRCKEFISG